MIKTSLFYHLENLTSAVFGPFVRRIGRRLVASSEAKLTS